jgi:hypothetical protein
LILLLRVEVTFESHKMAALQTRYQVEDHTVRRRRRRRSKGLVTHKLHGSLLSQRKKSRVHVLLHWTKKKKCSAAAAAAEKRPGGKRVSLLCWHKGQSSSSTSHQLTGKEREREIDREKDCHQLTGREREREREREGGRFALATYRHGWERPPPP